LLVGDTLSKTINPKDKANYLLFGDAGTASVIEKDKKSNKSYFSLNSDGSGYEAIIIRGGAFRNPCSEEILKNVIYEDGSIRSAVNLSMNGPDVFNFTIREVTKSIMDLLKFAKLTVNDTDYLVYHQANKFINDFLAKKLKYRKDRVPYSLEKFGNTASATIPITIVTELRNELTSGSKKLILSGFGVGLSWANAILDIENCHISELLEI
jgi:3-oxoacyl-[acyl-carrier-protein] synthase III